MVSRILFASDRDIDTMITEYIEYSRKKEIPAKKSIHLSPYQQVPLLTEQLQCLLLQISKLLLVRSLLHSTYKLRTHLI